MNVPPEHDRCTTCHSPAVATMSLYGGRRCAAHPDRFDAQVAVALQLAGWPDTSRSYIRTFAALDDRAAA